MTPSRWQQIEELYHAALEREPPIAAVLFTLEEVMGDMHAPVLGSIVLSPCPRPPNIRQVTFAQVDVTP